LRRLVPADIDSVLASIAVQRTGHSKEAAVKRPDPRWDLDPDVSRIVPH